MSEEAVKIRVEFDDASEMQFRVVFGDRKKGKTDLTEERWFWDALEEDLSRKENGQPSNLEMYAYLRREKVMLINRRDGADVRVEFSDLKDLAPPPTSVDNTPGPGVYVVRLWPEFLDDLSKVASLSYARQRALGITPTFTDMGSYVRIALIEEIERQYRGIRKRDRDSRINELLADDKKVQEEAQKVSKKAEEKKP